MEEAPKPTYQEELEWCISQLETGLLHLNPTPKQVEETRHILGVLRSSKSPLVKKRQVMHHVFGDYRLKMAEERQRAAKEAVNPENTVHIQSGDTLSSSSVAYRKQANHPSAVPTSWFAPSDNTFQFDFVISKGTSEEIGGTAREAHEVDDSGEQSTGSSLSGTLDIGTEKPEFAFNFVIPDVPPLPSAAADPGSEAVVEAATGVDSTSQNATETMPESATFSKPNKSAAKSNGGRRDEGTVQEVSKSETAQAGRKLSGSSNRKKKKKQPPLKGAHGGNVNGDHRPCGEGRLDQTDMCQSDEQMKREVDWCIEQLELGLKTRKSTPKQMDEALRAIKTLRSEKAVLAKKRQLMRALFGDYRKKIAEERQKQLKLMQAASKAARIAEVTEDACRKSSRVFRKSAVMARRDQRPAGSFIPSSTQTASTCSFALTSSQEEFCFNFF
ncbi:uncharacterized protein LOC117056688 [Lacerta agilis]|uniref:uncharacterized protein LOC117056688 n=1 Tax=Lacerta agilis TaxID=80427 RepID=UPI001419DAA0|nr:uncharacterized protein LOC117056688 [Lacerta agilis]XP_033023167.1 uncharacterized protein LOC117056688 [Lacerta agilis]XP_033023168.1 uncharacterized protein LOC117056688 [Lacerta agilis]